MPGLHRVLDSSPPKTKAVSQGGGTSPMWETEQTDTPNSILMVSGESDLTVNRTVHFTEKHRDISGALPASDPRPDSRWSSNTVLKTSEVTSDVSHRVASVLPHRPQKVSSPLPQSLFYLHFSFQTFCWSRKWKNKNGGRRRIWRDNNWELSRIDERCWRIDGWCSANHKQEKHKGNDTWQFPRQPWIPKMQSESRKQLGNKKTHHTRAHDILNYGWLFARRNKEARSNGKVSSRWWKNSVNLEWQIPWKYPSKLKVE